jgi:hypothetical protein
MPDEEQRALESTPFCCVVGKEEEGKNPNVYSI